MFETDLQELGITNDNQKFRKLLRLILQTILVVLLKSIRFSFNSLESLNPWRLSSSVQNLIPEDF